LALSSGDAARAPYVIARQDSRVAISLALSTFSFPDISPLLRRRQPGAIKGKIRLSITQYKLIILMGKIKKPDESANH
jgi:hypothetical protein